MLAVENRLLEPAGAILTALTTIHLFWFLQHLPPYTYSGSHSTYHYTLILVKIHASAITLCIQYTAVTAVVTATAPTVRYNHATAQLRQLPICLFLAQFIVCSQKIKYRRGENENSNRNSLGVY
jgi:hypothetical protein